MMMTVRHSYCSGLCRIRKEQYPCCDTALFVSVRINGAVDLLTVAERFINRSSLEVYLLSVHIRKCKIGENCPAYIVELHYERIAVVEAASETEHNEARIGRFKVGAADVRR